LTTNKSFATSLWDFFCSLKLSISLLIGLAVTSIIGTVIPQGPPPPEYLQTISETKFLLYQKLGFFDMYHSWWFITLLYLLTLNLIACSIKRLPRVWKIISEPTLVMDSGLERSLTCTRQFRMPGDAATLRDRMAEFLKAEFSEPVEVTGQDINAVFFKVHILDENIDVGALRVCKRAPGGDTAVLVQRGALGCVPDGQGDCAHVARQENCGSHGIVRDDDRGVRCTSPGIHCSCGYRDKCKQDQRR